MGGDLSCFATRGSSAPIDPPPTVEPDAVKLVLTTPGAANQLVFDRIDELRAGRANVPLTLRSHPGLALVRRHDDFKAPGGWQGDWLVAPLGIGSAERAVCATYERGAYLTYSHGGWARKVLDIAEGKYEVGNDVNFVGHTSNAKRTYLPFGGREFVLNPDGTVKAKFGNHLVLGVDPPDCTLVKVQNGGNKLVLEPQVAQALRNGQAAPLTLASHPGYAIVPKTEQPRRFKDSSYRQLGVGPAARGAMVARLEGSFLVSHHPSTMNYVFDVPFGNLNEHCHGNAGKLPIAAINQGKDEGNAARLFVLNADGTISPQRASNLVFGIRGLL